MSEREDTLLLMLYGLLPEAAKRRMEELEGAEEAARQAQKEVGEAQRALKGKLELLAQVEPRLQMMEAKANAREALLVERERLVDEMHKEAEEKLGRARRDHARAKRAAEAAESMFNDTREGLAKFRTEVEA